MLEFRMLLFLLNCLHRIYFQLYYYMKVLCMANGLPGLPGPALTSAQEVIRADREPVTILLQLMEGGTVGVTRLNAIQSQTVVSDPQGVSKKTKSKKSFFL